MIVVCWNSAAHLARCLDCLREQTFHDFEVILIDNGSTDGSTEGLEEKYPSLDLLIRRLESNHGFAAANNLGAQLARGQWLALLNADAFPEPDWLERLLQATAQHPEAVSFSSRQIQAGNAALLDGAGDAYHVSGWAWQYFRGYSVERYGATSVEIFSACGASALYKRQTFLDVGGFDEDFFAYYEDVDLGFRLRLHDYRAFYVPQAVVHHVGSVTFGRRSDFVIYYCHRNLIWTFVKNMPPTLLWKYLPLHLMTNVIFLMWYSLRSPGKAVWRSKWDALRGLRRMLVKRRDIQRHRSVSTSDLEREMEHGWLRVFLRRFAERLF